MSTSGVPGCGASFGGGTTTRDPGGEGRAVIVDVHGHITPHVVAERFPVPPALLDVDRMLDERSEAGVGLTIVGSPVGFGAMLRAAADANAAQTLDDLKRLHDALAELVGRHPSRLRAYAYVDPFAGDRALDAARRAVEEQGFVGLIANSSVRGRYLDVPQADDFFSMAASLGVPLLLHPPAVPVGSDALFDDALAEQVGRFADVTVGLAALVFAGRIERHPGLRIIGASAGGAISLLPERLDRARSARHWEGATARGGMAPVFGDSTRRQPSEYVGQLYVDTATPSGAALLADLAVLGPRRMLFGTDSPPLAVSLSGAIRQIRQLPVPPDEQAMILGGNAMELFQLPLGSPAAA